MLVIAPAKFNDTDSLHTVYIFEGCKSCGLKISLF